MTVTTEGYYLGDLRTRLVHGPTGAEVLAGAPREYRPDSAHFSPTDLVAAALGSCMLGYLGIVGGRCGIDLTGMRVRVEKELRMEPPRRIASLSVTLYLPAELNGEVRQKLETAARTCPVRQSLHPDVAVGLRFVYGAEPAAR